MYNLFLFEVVYQVAVLWNQGLNQGSVSWFAYPNENLTQVQKAYIFPGTKVPNDLNGLVLDNTVSNPVFCDWGSSILKVYAV